MEFKWSLFGNATARRLVAAAVFHIAISFFQNDLRERAMVTQTGIRFTNNPLTDSSTVPNKIAVPANFYHNAYRWILI
jgi:hypothetical protein